MDSYIYQYAIGGVIFAVGLYFAGRQGYIGFSGRGLRNLLLMLGGMMFFMVLQGCLQYAPMSELDAIPYTGEARAERTIGKPIDFAIVAVYVIMIVLIGTWFGDAIEGRNGTSCSRGSQPAGGETLVFDHGATAGKNR